MFECLLFFLSLADIGPVKQTPNTKRGYFVILEHPANNQYDGLQSSYETEMYRPHKYEAARW